MEAFLARVHRIEKWLAPAVTPGPEPLTQASLAKTFWGELVPTEAGLARQVGRDYEPASVLLDRIPAQGELRSKQTSVSRTTTPITAPSRAEP